MLSRQILIAACLAGYALAKRPNIVFLLTDDQDKQLDSLNYMYGVQYHLMDQGATFENHFCTVSLCCPSRANLWTGRCAHNTNITSNAEPGGGYAKFAASGLNDNWLFPWMQQAGYQNYFVGKLLNGFDETNYNKPYPKGFNGTGFLCGAATYNYYKPKFQINNEKPKTVNQYATYAIGNMSLNYLDGAIKHDDPFFLVMAVVAPHSGSGPKPEGFENTRGGPIPAEAYVHAFPDLIVPRTENFNPNVSSGVDWVQDLPMLNSTQVTDGDVYYRNRIRALQSVDDLVNNTMAYLDNHGLLNNTYFIYSTDNGFHIGQHRLLPGKNLPFETDVNVPMIIRGPGIKPKTVVDMVTSHTDIAATILHIAGADLPAELDGTPMPVIDPSYNQQSFLQVGIEHWGSASQDEDYIIPAAKNTTYKALRVIGQGYDYYYSTWCGGGHELYNMTVDSQQMHNLYMPYTLIVNESIAPLYSINRLESRLNGLMLVLKDCKASTCTEPWLALHPSGNVSNLNDAMNPLYDLFYEQQQPKVAFNYCDDVYKPAAEGPQTYFGYV